MAAIFIVNKSYRYELGICLYEVSVIVKGRSRTIRVKESDLSKEAKL